MPNNFWRRYLNEQGSNMILWCIPWAFLGRDLPQLISNKFCWTYSTKTSRDLWEICSKKCEPEILQHVLGSNAVFENMLNCFLNGFGRYTRIKRNQGSVGELFDDYFWEMFPKHVLHSSGIFSFGGDIFQRIAGNKLFLEDITPRVFK